MNKLKFLTFLFSISIFILLISLVSSKDSYLNVGPQPVIADHDDDYEEDEDEDEREEEDDDDDYEEDDYYEYITEPSENSTINTQETPTPTYIKVVDQGYETDSDKDLLVDAIDPHPQIPEINFFTDSDGDTVSDAYDTYPGKDDFTYVEFQDIDADGILDSIE
ncbi:MAG: hypothetical protein QG570_506 [Patescibacteria group bacterium]|nr:hypothetical protein [Patescibacteria group bacterium]